MATTSPMAAEAGSEKALVDVKIDATASPKPAPTASSGAGAAVIKKPFKASRTPPLWVALNPLIWLLWLLDFLVWLVYALLWPPAMYRFISFTVFGHAGISSTSHVDMESGFTFRTRKPLRGGRLDLITFPFGKEHSTVHQVLQEAFRRYGELKCMGTRAFVKMHTPEGAKFPLKVFGSTSWKTYNEVSAEAKAFGAGLLSPTIGMEPMPLEVATAATQRFEPITGPHTLVIFEETCAAWTTACIGAMGQSIAVATSYATLGMPAVAEALNQTSAPAILCNYKDVSRLAAACDEACPNLKTIIYTRNYVGPEAPSLPPTIGRLHVLSMSDVQALGEDALKQQPEAVFHEPTPEHLGLIMYTSGSTGKPKGVMLTHKAIVAAVAGLENYFCTEVGNRATQAADQEVYLAYLPAAHILEFAAEMSMLTHGAMLGYSDPKSIASAGAMRLLEDGTLNGTPTGFGNNPPGGIQEFGPTVMAAVPKIWDILKKGVEDNVGKASPAVQAIFLAAFAARSAALEQSRETPLLGLLFKKKIATLLGGRIKCAVTGGGPISADVHNFVRTAMHFPLVQGYGLTETCSCGTVQPSNSVLDGVAGSPVVSVMMHLESCAKKDEAGNYEFLDRSKKPYLNTDRHHYGEPCLGRGEVWIKGDPISSGYYTEEAMTRKEFDSDGWFHTGDIAIWTPAGTLKIVDRLKNLVKLKGGEYVAIESMEATYAASVFVNGKNGGIMCYADSDMDKPVALVQANEDELKKWAKASEITFDSFEELCNNPAACAMVTADLNSVGKGKLGLNEALATVALLPGTGAESSTAQDAPWTSENGYLTAANKLARGTVKEGFRSVIDAIKPKAIR